jgi:hypothetical protein
MIEHRNAVREKLVALEVDGLRKLNLSRDQVLARLWELANLSHEVTRGSIAGQIKAVSLIIAMEGLIPGRGPSPSAIQPTAPSVSAEIYQSEWLRKKHQDADPGDAVVPSETKPVVNHVPHPEPAPQPTPPLEQNHTVANPIVIPEGRMRVPDATAGAYDALPDTRQPFSIQKGPFGRRR